MATTISAPLAGKVAIVTGASRGIGAGIAKTLAEQGCTHISITYTSKPEKAQETLDEIKAISPAIKTTAIKANVLDDDFAKIVVQTTLKNLQVDHIDIVVANAAVVDGTKAEEVTKAEFEKNYTGNVWAQYDLAQTAIQHMPQGGRIIFISSAYSKMGLGLANLPYAVTKAGLDSVSRNLATAWGAAKGITVNSISTGATVTDTFWNASKVLGMEEKPFMEMMGSFSNLKRVGQVDDVADIVAFVASPAARWINGNQIPANGGVLTVLQS